jgi:Protein of unknown function (DUF3365)
MNRNISRLLMAAALGAGGVLAVAFAASPGGGTDRQARVDAAGATAQAFLKRLGSTMQAEMQSGGPAAAMKVCRDVAPRAANELSLEKGWKVTRVGTRVRNPLLGTPDAWEQGVLAQFEKRAAQGEKFDDMTWSEVVVEPSGKSLRYMKAIAVAPQCLVCHGSAEQIPEAVRAELETLYPHDRAVNYRPGDLRGAVSIKQPLDD